MHIHIGEVQSIVLIIGGFLTIFGIMLKGLGLLRKFGRKLNLFFEDFFGEAARPGVPERPGVVVRLGRVEEDISVMKTAILRIDAQVHHNGGSSMRDDVSAIRETVKGPQTSNVTVHVNTPEPGPEPAGSGA